MEVCTKFLESIVVQKGAFLGGRDKTTERYKQVREPVEKHGMTSKEDRDLNRRSRKGQ